MPTENADRTTGIIAILGLAAMFLGFIVMILLPDLRITSWGILILGVLLLVTAFILDYRRVGSAITGRRGRFSAGTTVMVSIFIGLTLVINAISLSSYQRFDFTGLAQFTLTRQTQEVLSQLEEPIRVLHFSTPTDVTGISGYVVSLLTEYRNYTDQIKVETIDPDEHPDQARKYSVNQYQTVVFEKGNSYRLVNPQEIVEEAEHSFTSAILEVSGTVQKKIYFLSGHGEPSIDSQAPGGYSRTKLGLNDNLYRTESLYLRASPAAIPEDATALVIAGPERPLTSSEMEIIRRYLENGGWVLILLNPESPDDIRQLVADWGIDIKDGLVIDKDSYVSPSVDSPLIPQDRNFFALAEIYFSGVTALIPQEEASAKYQMQPLAWTSNNSWLETTFNPQRDNQFDEGTETKGPLALAVVISTTTGSVEDSQPGQTRLIIIGDSDFAANQHFYSGNNGEFFVNSLHLLTAGKELISIERKILPFRRLVVGPDAERFINISSIGLLPALILIAGVVVWWRRR